jgi:tetratricopeptide (TPR) repeat protein
MKNFCLIISVLLLVTGCASKRFAKQASKFEQAGLYEDAAEYYYKAVKKKDSNVEAKLGLRRNGQIGLDNKLANFLTAYNGADYEKAVSEYQNADIYYRKIKQLGVDLNFPDTYRTYYQEAKDDYLNKKYIDGLDKLSRDEFTAARLVFEEIINIDPSYKDAKEKYTIAKAEPKYREANNLLENGLYRKAYYKFAEISNIAKDYKQTTILKEEALEKGTITILVTDFTCVKAIQPETSKLITNKVRAQLQELNNPFIKIMDPSSVSPGIFDKGKINLQAANLVGIKAVIYGNIAEIVRTEGKLNKTMRKGYLKEVYKVKDESGNEVEKIKWHKTEYTEFDMENYARLNMSFKMVSTADGEICTSDSYNLSNSDKLHYAKFEGEKKNLVPGYWKNKDTNSPEDVIKNNPGDINALKQLLNAQQTIKTTAVLLDELIDRAINGISNKVDKYNPEGT